MANFLLPISRVQKCLFSNEDDAEQDKENCQVKKFKPEHPKDPNRAILQERNNNILVCRRSERWTVQNKWGCISPIAENKYAPLAVVIHQGIPDGRLKFNKKMSLSRNNVGHRLDTIEGYFDDFSNSTDLLEDVISIQLQKEDKYILRANFLQTYNTCQTSRSTVINWLIQIQEYLSLPYQEIFATVYLLDLVFSSTRVAANMYQLVGLAISWIISKHDDVVNSPTIQKMLNLCKCVYTKQQFLKMEKKLLIFFDFKLNIVDVSIFVLFYMQKLNIKDKKFLHCAYYVLECFTLSEMYSTKRPSIKAAAAVSLVANILQVCCPKTLISDLDEVKALEKEMLLQVQNIQDPRFTFRQPFIKYSSTKYCQASVVILHHLVAS